MRRKSNSLVLNSLVAVSLGIAIIALWLLFTGSFNFHELLLGASFTILTLILTALAWRGMGVLFNPTLAQVAQLWRLPWYVLHDSIEVTVILLKDLAGIRRAGSHFRAEPFPSGSGRHERERTVLATAGTTITPSLIVLGIADGHILLHQLQRSPIPRMIRDLRGSRTGQ